MPAISFSKNSIKPFILNQSRENIFTSLNNYNKKYLLKQLLRNLGSQSTEDIIKFCEEELSCISEIVDANGTAYYAEHMILQKFPRKDRIHINKLIALFTNRDTGLFGQQNITKRAAQYTKILMLILSKLNNEKKLEKEIQKNINLVLNEANKWYRSDYLKYVRVEQYHSSLIIQFDKKNNIFYHYDLEINILNDSIFTMKNQRGLPISDNDDWQIHISNAPTLTVKNQKGLPVSDDFNKIKNLIHPYSFNDNFSYLENDLVVVWNIPTDIFYIDNLEIPKIPFEVGTYYLYDDINFKQYSMATKLRRDIKIDTYEVVSIHTFKVEEQGLEYELPGISTSLFFDNCFDPTEDELQKVKDMINSLKEELNIHAYLSIKYHNAIIIDRYGEERMTPAILAKKLDTELEILNFILKAAKNAMGISKWHIAFMKYFECKI